MSLAAFPGECLGLVGENGAGKSTLMKILAGVWPHGSYEGDIYIEGSLQEFKNPSEASNAGIAIIHQELALFDELSVAENIFIQCLPRSAGIFDQTGLHKKTEGLLEDLGFEISSEMLVKDLSIAQRQLVEIARALSRQPKVLIFDEPTSALSDQEIEQLFRLIDRLKTKQIACVYISHKLEEIRRLCERVVVLRDGESVKQLSKFELSDALIIQAMVGRNLEALFPPRTALKIDEILFEVRNLSVKSPTRSLHDITFQIHKGEILGVAGLMGSGRSQLLHALFGDAQGEQSAGEFFLESKATAVTSPASALQQGIALVTEDRKATGLFLERALDENISIAQLKQITRAFMLQKNKEIEMAEYYRRLLKIKAPNLDFLVRYMSGGNQQKAILARWLNTHPKLLLLDEPTRGIDVGAKAEIYSLIQKLSEQGLSILLASSELPEIVSLCHRCLVMSEGRLKGILSQSELTQTKIMERALAA